MNIKRERISDDMNFVAVTDSDNYVVVFGIFSSEDDASNASEMISALLEKSGLALKDRLEKGIRRYPYVKVIASIREMKATGVGSPVEEIR